MPKRNIDIVFFILMLFSYNRHSDITYLTSLCSFIKYLPNHLICSTPDQLHWRPRCPGWLMPHMWNTWITSRVAIMLLFRPILVLFKLLVAGAFFLNFGAFLESRCIFNNFGDLLGKLIKMMGNFKKIQLNPVIWVLNTYFVSKYLQRTNVVFVILKTQAPLKCNDPFLW